MLPKGNAAKRHDISFAEEEKKNCLFGFNLDGQAGRQTGSMDAWMRGCVDAWMHVFFFEEKGDWNGEEWNEMESRGEQGRAKHHLYEYKASKPASYLDSQLVS